LLFLAEKLPAKSSGSHSIDKWFSSSDHGTKLVKKPVDISAKSESIKTSASLSGGGIWGEFDCDSVSDAVLLTAADDVEHREIKMEHSRPDGVRQFPGRGQKLCEETDRRLPVESIVRRIPGVGVISRRTLTDDIQLRDDVGKHTVTAAATSPHLHQSLSDNTLWSRSSSTSDNGLSTSTISSVKYESVVDFRKTIGMVLSPPGTEVHVKNFMSVCNHSARPSLSHKNLLTAPRLKTGHLLSDGDTDVPVRPVKKLRSDVEDAKRNFTASSDSKNWPMENNKQSQQNLEELNAYDSDKPSATCGVWESSVEEMGHVDLAAIGGAGSNVPFEQTRAVNCPVCQVSVPATTINEHLDQCLV